METVAAVDGLVPARLERHLGRTSAATAGRLEHLALPAVSRAVEAAAAAAAAGLAGRATIRATARLVLETFLCVEFLLASGKRKLVTAVDACNELIGIHLGENSLRALLEANNALVSDIVSVGGLLTIANGRTMRSDFRRPGNYFAQPKPHEL